jgi:phage gp29-like protein
MATSGSLILPASFEHCLARDFKTPLNKPNELRLNDHSVDGAEFWDYGWLNHFHKAKSGYISRSGLHRVLCYPYLFKNYGVKDILEFLEIYGLPIVLVLILLVQPQKKNGRY